MILGEWSMQMTHIVCDMDDCRNRIIVQGLSLDRVLSERRWSSYPARIGGVLANSETRMHHCPEHSYKNYYVCNPLQKETLLDRIRQLIWGKK